MILVDSSVWIDYFNGKATPATAFFDAHVEEGVFCVGDLMLTEVLQGFNRDKEYHQALEALGLFPLVKIGGRAIAIKAAEHYRALRKKGVTLRGVVDVLIGTYCIEHAFLLLYSDRDFDAMVKHLGLQSALKALS